MLGATPLFLFDTNKLSKSIFKLPELLQVAPNICGLLFFTSCLSSGVLGLEDNGCRGWADVGDNTGPIN